MLGVISQSAPTILITKTLSVLVDTLDRGDNDVLLMEALSLCLARFVPLLDEVRLHSLVDQPCDLILYSWKIWRIL